MATSSSKTLSTADIRKIAGEDDLHIAPFRDDGKTYGTLTWIWSVSVDNALYVRAYHGIKSRWYQAAIKQKAGKIQAAGMTKKVRFRSVGGEINDLIDEAYKIKYKGSPFVKAMTSEKVREATIRIVSGD
jgi:hypothetical protein